MAQTAKSHPPEETREAAEQNRHRDHLTPPPESGGEETTLATARATLTLLSAWLLNLQSLARLELSRSLTAGKRIAALSLLLLPLVLTLILSLCAGAGLIGYRYSQSVYVGFAIFVLAQILIVAGILLYQRKMAALLGFHETRQQAKAIINDFHETFK